MTTMMFQVTSMNVELSKLFLIHFGHISFWQRMHHKQITTHSTSISHCPQNMSIAEPMSR